MMEQERAAFVETQRFRQRWIWMMLSAVAAITIGNLSFGMYREFVLGKPFSHGEPLSDGTWLMIWVVGVAATIGPMVLLRSSRLVTRVGPKGLTVRFAPFHRRPRRIDLSDVASVESITYSALREYGGYGMRSTRNESAYNVGGNQGVRITFRGGKHLLIGSRRADELASAIEAARHATQDGG